MTTETLLFIKELMWDGYRAQLNALELIARADLGEASITPGYLNKLVTDADAALLTLFNSQKTQVAP